MLKTGLVHPEILNALAGAGHTGKVVIADGDYPVATTAGVNAEIVHLNLMPGSVTATDTLKALLSVMVIEDAEVMDVPEGRDEPEIWNEFRSIIKEYHPEIEMKKLERFAFYDKVKQDDVALVIQTGETRDYACLILTIGSLW